jgi:hypothetical protein
MNRPDHYPTPILPPGCICFIVAFVIAGAISEKHLFAIGIPLTYLLIKLVRHLKVKFKCKEEKEFDRTIW